MPNKLLQHQVGHSVLELLLIIALLCALSTLAFKIYGGNACPL
jgi:hypothetical protein